MQCSDDSRLVALRVHFLNPLDLDLQADVEVNDASSDRCAMEIIQRKRVATRLEMELALNATPVPIHPGKEAIFTPGERKQPREWSRNQIAQASGTMKPQVDGAALAARFPRLQRAFSLPLLCELSALSTVVGMECPGRDSLFAELSTTCRRASLPGDQLTYRVVEWDARFSALRLAVDGPWLQTQVRAFVRPRPCPQISYAQVVAAGNLTDWAGRTALIVGGSRGLGEVAAKLLAAGGARVILTYHKGQADAERLCAEIIVGGGAAEAWPADLLDLLPFFQRLRDAAVVPQIALVFGTPPLSAESAQVFEYAQFMRLAQAYVEGFQQVWGALRELQPGAFVMFYPSTVFVADPVRGMLEYAAAKAAGEQLCRSLQGVEPRGAIVVRRLPRLATDLTLSLVPGLEADPVPVMRDVLSEMNAALIDREKLREKS